MRRQRCHTFSSRRGLITPDAVMGLAIITILAAALVVALNRRQHAGDRLSDTRGAAWAAEQALVEMQAGGKPAPAADGTSLLVEAIPGEEPAAGGGYVW